VEPESGGELPEGVLKGEIGHGAGDSSGVPTI
jgi:hypothetical protein